MGASQSLCGQNLITKLYQQYGTDKVLQFITKQKSKLIIQEQFTLLTRKFHQSFLQFQSTLKQIIQSKIQQITIKFQQLKNKTNSLLPGGVAVLQRVKGKSVNQFSGFNNILNQIQLIKQQSLNNLSLKKSQMIQQIQQQKQLMIINLTKTQPSIPLYKQIPQPIKRMLFIQLQKTYQQKFINNKSGLQQKIMGLFNASALYRMFQEMSPVGVIEKMVVDGFGGMERNLLKSLLG